MSFIIVIQVLFVFFVIALVFLFGGKNDVDSTEKDDWRSQIKK